MNAPIITGLYAGILAIISILLSARVVQLRVKTGVGIGAKGQPELNRALRAHGNFSEYVPLAVILLALLETMTDADQSMRIHGLGATLVAARILHAFGLSRRVGMSLPRGTGYLFTLLVTLACAVMLMLRFAQAQ